MNWDDKNNQILVQLNAEVLIVCTQVLILCTQKFVKGSEPPECS